ncbi:MAG: hypothetical protein N3F10_05675 [Candidatus Bathyarchaeota archaeon]|nr:hypothetical protein [Candidatus Bathyarchaeota archaeon]
MMKPTNRTSAYLGKFSMPSLGYKVFDLDIQISSFILLSPPTQIKPVEGHRNHGQ